MLRKQTAEQFVQDASPPAEELQQGEYSMLFALPDVKTPQPLPDVKKTPQQLPSSDPATQAFTFEDEGTLLGWLTERGVNSALWDRLQVSVLLEELRSGASELRMERGSPLRVVRVINVRIVSDDGRRTLVCTHKVEEDGKRTEVGRPVSGKLRVGDTGEGDARRCAKEDLDVDITPLLSTKTEHTAAKSMSRKFPGLVSRFVVVFMDAGIEVGRLEQQSFKTEAGSRCWDWQWRLTLPGSGFLCVHTFVRDLWCPL